MQTLAKIEEDVKQLSKAEQEALRAWLDNVLEDELEFTDEFKAKIKRAKRDIPKAVVASSSHDLVDGQGRGHANSLARL